MSTWPPVRGSQDKVSDPDLPALGDPGQRSVSVDICRAAYLSGSPLQLTLSRISHSVMWSVKKGTPTVNSPVSADSNAKTLGVRRLQFPEWGREVGLQTGLILRQNSIPDVATPAPYIQGVVSSNF